MGAKQRRAFSYIRFSHPKQALGGGLKRQADLSAEWCQRNHVTLDESLTLHDLGVSAFRGDNVRDGALAGFLEACRMGRVASGSYLIIESLDRLSRDQIRPALQLFLTLHDHGITIVTLQPERLYAPEQTDAMALIEPLVVFARAHEESLMKSHRREKAWKHARDKARSEGKPLMKTCPAWLEVTEDEYKVKEEAAATVRRIYTLCAEGMGVDRITTLLTREKVKPIGTSRRWVKAYVYRILSNPAAMGTYQPCKQVGAKRVTDGEPIPDYFPAVVDAEEWHQVQTHLRTRSGGFKVGKANRGAGRVSHDVNLFAKLVYCAVTKGAMHLAHAMGRKQPNGKRKRYVYLASTRPNGVVVRKYSIDYASFEAALLHFLRELQPRDVATKRTAKHADKRESQVAALSGRLLDLDNRLSRAKERALTESDFDTYLDLIKKLQDERTEVAEQLEQLRQEAASNPTIDLGETQSLIEMLDGATAEQAPELRRRLKTRIRALVKEIWVLVQTRGRGMGKAPRHAYVQIYLRSGGIRNIVVHHPRPVADVAPLAAGLNLREYHAAALGA
jgi:DNA invertase Pin-like site-specific DNA recombinase